MLPSWERILYFHALPAVFDGLLALLGILLIMRIFRVRNPSFRAVLFFIPLIRPLLIFLEGGARLERRQLPNVQLAVRIPDPLRLIPVDVAGDQELSTVSWLIALLVTAALATAVFFLVLRWIGFLTFYRRLRHHSSPVSRDSHISVMVNQLSEKLGLAQPPEILVVEGNWATPCAIGFRHPALVVDPHFLAEFEPEELRAILAHELGHIRRRDCIWHWASVLLRDIQSFNPFSHMSIAKIGLEREKACDSVALEITQVSPVFLAECLVKSAGKMQARDLEPLPGYGMSFFRGEHRLLENRLNFLLALPDDETRITATARKATGKLKAAGLLLLCVPLTLLQIYFGAWIGDFPLVIK